MFYNSYAKAAKEQFANKVTVVTCPEDVELASYNLVFAIPVFLAGGITNCEEWQKIVINYFKENWKHERGIIFLNPRRDSFDVTNPDATLEQIKWEFKYLSHRNVAFSMYFADSDSSQPICFYEMGRAVGMATNKHFQSKKLFIATNNKFFRKEDVLIQGKLADYGGTPIFVESAEEYAEKLLSWIEDKFDTNLKLESSPDFCCRVCKYFIHEGGYGLYDWGFCKHPNQLYEDIVDDDNVCEFFESEKQKVKLEVGIEDKDTEACKTVGDAVKLVKSLV